MPEYELHKRTRQSIVRIGVLEGYDAKTEWPADEPEAFDGAWFRPTTGESPTHVFEVHIGGDRHKAITKLMRAQNRWGGCQIRLVTTKAQLADLRAEVAATVSQADVVAWKVINEKAIHRLLKHLSPISEMREEIGYEHI